MKKRMTYWLVWCWVELLLAFVIVYTSVWSISQTKHLQDIVNNGEAVEAEIVAWGVKSNGAKQRGWNYVTYYRYKDENGAYYTGLAYQGLSGKEEAESLVGENTVIYIDGKGESVWSGLLPITITGEVVLISILSTVFLGIVIFLVISEIRLKKKLAEKQEEKE